MGEGWAGEEGSTAGWGRGRGRGQAAWEGMCPEGKEWESGGPNGLKKFLQRKKQIPPP